MSRKPAPLHMDRRIARVVNAHEPVGLTKEDENPVVTVVVAAGFSLRVLVAHGGAT